MWELLGWLVEGAVEVVSDLLEGDADTAGGAVGPAGVVVVPEAVLPVEATVAVAAPPQFEGVSALAADDGGISDSRWDPKPTAGPYTP